MVTIFAPQSELENVNVAGLTVPSLIFVDEILIVTSATGCVFNSIVKDVVPPASVVCKPLPCVTFIPAISLSAFVTSISSTDTLL